MSWFVFSISTETGLKATVEGVNALKLVLMYLPIGLVAVYVLLLLFRKTGLIQQRFQFLSLNERGNFKNTAKNKVKQPRGACQDEDLFIRAEEAKCPALVLTSGKEGFTLETTYKSYQE